jgi:probable HAF family extracellular repeat protein
VVLLFLIIVGGLFAPTANAKPLYNVILIGDSTSGVFDVNNVGQVVGETEISSGQKRTFFWDPVQGMRVLDFNGGRAISETGQIVGGGYRPIIWDAVNGQRTFVDPLVPSSAADINEKGQIAGNYYSDSNYAFAWDATTGLRSLGTLGGTYSVAHAINNLGQIVGRSRTADAHDRAFLWDPVKGFTNLGSRNSSSEAFDVNDRGQVVGETTGNGSQSFIWTAFDGMQIISGSSLFSSASGINNLGQVVGTQSSRAYLWDRAHGMRDLNDLIDPSSPWTLFSAQSISDTGYIVGSGDFEGKGRAFLLEPIAVPLPPAAMSGAIGAVLALGAARKVRRARAGA